MRKSEMNQDYNPQHDKMPPAAQEKHSFWTKPYTPFERKVAIACWIGVALSAVAAVNLALGRPWF